MSELEQFLNEHMLDNYVKTKLLERNDRVISQALRAYNIYYTREYNKTGIPTNLKETTIIAPYSMIDLYKIKELAKNDQVVQEYAAAERAEDLSRNMDLATEKEHRRHRRMELRLEYFLKVSELGAFLKKHKRNNWTCAKIKRTDARFLHRVLWLYGYDCEYRHPYGVPEEYRRIMFPKREDYFMGYIVSPFIKADLPKIVEMAKNDPAVREYDKIYRLEHKVYARGTEYPDAGCPGIIPW